MNFLKKSFYMSNKVKSITEKSIAVIIAKLMKKAVVIINGIFLARLMSLDDFGSFQQITLIASSIGLVGALGISKSYFYFLPRINTHEQKNFILQSILVSIGVYTCLAFILFFSLSPLSRGMNNLLLQQYSLILLIFLFNSIFTEYVEPILVALEKTTLYCVTVISFSFAEMLSLAIPLFHGAGVEFICLSYGLVGLAKFFFLSAGFFRLPGSVSLSFSYVKPMMAYSIPLSLTSIMVALGKRLDLFMISALFLTKDFALFSRGALEIPLAGIITFSLSGILVTEFVKFSSVNRFNEIKWLWNETARRTAMVFFPVFIFLFIFSQQFIITLYGYKYVESVIIFKIYLFLLPMQIMSWNSVSRAFGKTLINLYEGIIFVTSNILFNILFYFIFGFIGPAIGTVIAFYLSNFYTISRIYPLLQVDFEEFLPWKKLTKIAVVAAGCGLLSLPALFITAKPSFQLLCGGIIYSASFLFFTPLFLLTANDWKIVKKYFSISIFAKGK